MTEAKKVTEAVAEPIIELVEVIQLRYIVAALIIGAIVTFGAMYVIGQRMRAEGTDDGSGTED